MRTAAAERIHVIGGPGSGKTWLSVRLAEALDIDPIDLDRLPIRGVDGRQLQGPQRYDASLRRAEAIAAGEQWTTEGIYCGWTASLMDRADLIVWLDVPPTLAVARIVRRHVGLSIAGANNHKGLRLLYRFAGSVLRDDRPAATDEQLRRSMEFNSRATTAARLGGYSDKVVRCSTNDDVRRLLDSVRR